MGRKLIDVFVVSEVILFFQPLLSTLLTCQTVLVTDFLTVWHWGYQVAMKTHIDLIKNMLKSNNKKLFWSLATFTFKEVIQQN